MFPENGTKRSSLSEITYTFDKDIDASSVSSQFTLYHNNCPHSVTNTRVEGRKITYELSGVYPCGAFPNVQVYYVPKGIKGKDGSISTDEASNETLIPFLAGRMEVAKVSAPTSRVANMPGLVKVTLGEEIASIDPYALVVTGSCTTHNLTDDPKSFSGADLVVELKYATECPEGSTVTVSLDLTKIVGMDGVRGVGTALVATYTQSNPDTHFNAILFDAVSYSADWMKGELRGVDKSPTHAVLYFTRGVDFNSLNNALSHLYLSGTCVDHGHMETMPTSVSYDSNAPAMLDYDLPILNGGCVAGETLTFEFDPAAGTTDYRDDMLDLDGNQVVGKKNITMFMDF